jgi:hypothetical protein
MQPKNRKQTGLGILEIEVEHADGVVKTNPNGIAVSAMVALQGSMPDLPGRFPTGDVFNPHDLTPIDGVFSMLSGEPAVIYRTDEMEIPLSVDELVRFMAHDLKPSEFRVLIEHFGEFHEIHDDFYDPDTGESLQPIRVSESGQARHFP